MNLQKLLELEKPYRTVPLAFCFIPETCAGSNLRSLLSRSDWDKIRREEYCKSKHNCMVCRNIRGLPLHCHEEWKFHDEQLVQELIKLQVLCEYCHAAKHLGNTQANKPSKYFQNIVRHIQKINNWTDDEVIARAIIYSKINRIRSKYLWTMHVSHIYDRDVTIDWSREPEYRHPRIPILKVKLNKEN